MLNVLFLPVNSIQAEIFVKLVKYLKKKNVQSKFICLDSIYRKRAPNYLVEEILKKSNVNYKKIEDYHTLNPLKILKLESPDIVINSQDSMDSFINRFMNVAKKQGVPGLVIQDAFMFQANGPYNSPEQYSARTLSEKTISIARDAKHIFSIINYGYNWNMRSQRILERFYDILKGRSSLWGDGNYTKIAVMGDYTKNMLIKRGIDSSKIIITGQPRWDDLVNFTSSTIEKEILMKEFNLNPTKKIILLTTQPIVEAGMWTKNDREFYITNIIKIINQQEFNLIIKLHPRDDINIYRDILSRNGLENQCFVCQNFDTFYLLKFCDLLITHICTTALEAMILNKPVLAVDFKYSTDMIPYVSDRAALGVNHPKDLLQSVYLALDSVSMDPIKTTTEFVYNCAYLQDGKASERVAGLIIQIMDESKNKTFYSNSLN